MTLLFSNISYIQLLVVGEYKVVKSSQNLICVQFLKREGCVVKLSDLKTLSTVAWHTWAQENIDSPSLRKDQTVLQNLDLELYSEDEKDQLELEYHIEQTHLISRCCVGKGYLAETAAQSFICVEDILDLLSMKYGDPALKNAYLQLLFHAWVETDGPTEIQKLPRFWEYLLYIYYFKQLSIS